MIYGYARVSTGAQDLSGQLAQLKAAGCEKVFRDKLSGATADRPQLRRLMAALLHGDVVVIPAVDRLSRDTTDLLVIAREMQKAGAGIRSLTEPFLDTTSDFAEIVFAILGVAAKLERRRIRRQGQRREIRAQAEAHAAPAAGSTGTDRRGLVLCVRERQARRSAALPEATTSIRRRFQG